VFERLHGSKRGQAGARTGAIRRHGSRVVGDTAAVCVEEESEKSQGVNDITKKNINHVIESIHLNS
jgi:hypothetical protein